MKTTELYVEQVFIGFLVLAIFLLPWLPDVWRDPAILNKTNIAVAGSVIALGLAFLLGIPFDRLADTLTERLDQQHRLRFALKHMADRKLPNEGEVLPDPYPEDRLLLECLKDKPAVVDRLDYHRSRIRLARSMAVYGPAVTLMLVVGLMRLANQDMRIAAAAWGSAGIVGAYLLWTLLLVFAGCCRRLPRTYDDDFITHVLDKPQGSELRVWCSEWWVWAVPVSLLVLAWGLVLAAPWNSLRLTAAAAAAAGTIISVVSAWAWWRISDVYRRFLRDRNRYDDRHSPGDWQRQPRRARPGKSPRRSLPQPR